MEEMNENTEMEEKKEIEEEGEGGGQEKKGHEGDKK